MGELLYGGAIHMVKQAEIDAKRKTQAANNEKEGAASTLQRFSAMLGNRRRMDAAGSQINAIQSNIAKNVDAKASGDINGQIGLAEELGSQATMNSAAGIGGSSVDAYNSTVRLRAALGQENSDRSFASDKYAAEQDTGNTMIEATAGLDNNQYRANLDYRQYVDHHKMSAFQSVMTVGLAAAATFFGGAQAGMAVVGASEGMQKANNGDYDGASRDMMGAVQNGVAGIKNASKTEGKGFFNHSSSAPQVGGGSYFNYTMR